MKKTISVLSLIATLLLSSCSSEIQENSTDNKSITEKSEASMQSRQGTDAESVKENLRELFEKHLLYSENINAILDKNPNFDNSNFESSMNSAQTESDILEIFAEHGITVEADKLLDLIKERNAISESFSNDNVYFYTLSQEVREQYLNEVVNESSVSFSRTCREQYDISRKRCLRNYAIASVAVVVAGPFTAGIVTAIGGAAAVGIYASCLGDANDDYDDCVK